MFVYSQSVGSFWTAANALIDVGHSGRERGKNNHQMQDHPTGPIPQGGYTIVESFHSELMGLDVIRLHPDEETHTYGVDSFFIHGEQHGPCQLHKCIVLSRPARLLIAQSSDKRLYVQA